MLEEYFPTLPKLALKARRRREGWRLGELIQAQKESVGFNRGAAGQGRPKIGGAEAAQPKDERTTWPLAEAA